MLKMPATTPFYFGAPLVNLVLFLFIASEGARAGVPTSQDACMRLSEGAKISNTKALVIGYEGLFSSSPINANLLSSYREKLATGKKASRPFYAFGGSFLVRGPLTRIVENYKNKVQVLVFGRVGKTSADSIPGKCATIWMQDKGEGTEGRKVIIVGHSFGGGAAWELANSLRAKGVTVDGVVTADPRSPKQCMGECWNWAKPSNVSVWSNHYQRMPLRGHEVPGASNQYHSGYSHGTIQNAPAFYQAIANRIDGVKGPLLTAAPIHTDGSEKSGRYGDLNPSSISDASRSGSGNAENPATGKSQAPAAPIAPSSNGFLSAAARNSPSRSRADEERWFQRSSSYESTGGSYLAKKLVNDTGIFASMKSAPNGPNLGKSEGAIGSSGASLPGRAIAGEGKTEPKSSASTSEMLNKLWPLSKGDPSPTPSGSVYLGSSTESSSGNASLPMKDIFGSDSGVGNTAAAPQFAGAMELGSTSPPPSFLQASPIDQAQAAVTLFRRVHLKHERWFQRRDRF